MPRRRLPLTLVVLGAVIVLAAIIAAAVVRSSDTATLSLGERPDVPVVTSEPGVLDAVDPTVTVRVTADDDEPVVLAIGRTSEVEAWLGESDHLRVTGLSSWEELTVETVTGTGQPTDDPTDAATTDVPATEEAAAPDDAEQPAPGTVPNPAGSDLWVVEATGTGSAELTWTDRPGRWSLVAATDGTGPAPLVELEWGRQVSTPWLVPGIVLGAAALTAGLVMMVLGVLADREQRRREDALARRSRGEDLTDTAAVRASVTDTDPGTGERLSRRQIREMERAMAQDERRRRAGEDVPPPIPQRRPVAELTVDAELRPADGTSPDPAVERTDDPVAEPTGAAAGNGTQPSGPESDAERSEPTGPQPDAERSEPTGPQPDAERPEDGDHWPPRPADDVDGWAQPAEDLDDAAGRDHATPQPAEGTDPSTWRSVWGFGGSNAPAPDHDDDDREERR